MRTQAGPIPLAHGLPEGFRLLKDRDRPVLRENLIHVLCQDLA
jgi:hypothetical protein